MDLKSWLRQNPDRAAAWAAIVLGGPVIFLGWLGVSGTEFPAEQIPYLLSGGLSGALLMAFGATLLISADLRDEWRKLDRIERHLAGEGVPEPTAESTAAPTAVSSDAPPIGDTSIEVPGTASARNNGRGGRLAAEGTEA